MIISLRLSYEEYQAFISLCNKIHCTCPSIMKDMLKEGEHVCRNYGGNTFTVIPPVTEEGAIITLTIGDEEQNIKCFGIMQKYAPVLIEQLKAMKSIFTSFAAVFKSYADEIKALSRNADN